MAGLNRKLAGKWAVVTGGHVRVGRAISLELADARMNLIVTYHTSPDAAEKAVAEFVALGVQAHALAVDLSDAADSDSRSRRDARTDRHGAGAAGQ